MRSVVAVLPLLALVSACAVEHGLVDEIAYSIDESDGCMSPDANEFQAVAKAAAKWADEGVTITAGGDGHPVAVCFVAQVPYDKAPEGWRAVGRVIREETGSRMFIEAGRSHADTTATVTHEFGHVVTWSPEHAEGHGLMSCCNAGSEWTSDDLDYLASLGL
jgi:hypothetical protein